MKSFRLSRMILVSGAIGATGILFFLGCRDAEVDFNTQVKPLINKKCISCHGGVKAKSGFSLLFREDALGPTKSGKPAIIPGDPDHSPLMKRISSSDPEERMPYKHAPLSKEEISLFRRWISQGAKWGRHWAYIPVKPVPAPEAGKGWARNDIDRFIAARLQEEQLTPSPEADKSTLLRRVSLDLIGMPAPDSIAQQYLSDSSSLAYENLVDALMATSFYGEKWATMWLDLARYADTRGYEADRSRAIWKYRDWVIRALNSDKPYDSFLLEQVAGDLLPHATDDQLIATGFHRNTMTNDEGGTDNEEFRTAAVLDRVNTTWTAVMGTTFSCVQCHSHPYDPFRHDEYYKFMAFLNNSRDEDTQAEYPLLKKFKPADSTDLAELQRWLKQEVSDSASEYWTRFLKTWQPTINSLQCDQYQNAALSSSWWAGLRNKGSCRLANVYMGGRTEFTSRFVTYKPGGVLDIHLDSLGGRLLKRIDLPFTKNTWGIVSVPIEPVEGRHHLFFSYRNPNIHNTDEYGILFDWFRVADPFPGKDKPGYDRMRRLYVNVMNAVPASTTPIMIENNAAQFRRSYVFERGNWLVKGDEVKPDIPAVFGGLPKNGRHDRLGLARWLVSRENPLTSRSIVNHIWEQLFGNGLVETLDDFGSQGALPTHPALLDWLAGQLMQEDEWHLKKLVRSIVTSATYRQSSAVNKQLLDADPYNTLYARGPRVRLSAEQIRDQALAVSGALCTRMYGPGIMPYQPEGIWNSPYNGEQWKQSEGDEQYRRAVYIYWKRSAAYPSTVSFDGPARQVCVARRIRTNTPLQSLTLLNDPAYLDLARQLAYRMQKASPKDVSGQIRQGYAWAAGKEITAGRLAVFEKLYRESFERFSRDKDATCEMIGIMDEHNNPETAALVVVSNALMNLDEVVMKY